MEAPGLQRGSRDTPCGFRPEKKIKLPLELPLKGSERFSGGDSRIKISARLARQLKAPANVSKSVPGGDTYERVTYELNVAVK